jgi:hypothetical protein
MHEESEQNTSYAALVIILYFLRLSGNRGPLMMQQKAQKNLKKRHNLLTHAAARIVVTLNDKISAN